MKVRETKPVLTINFTKFKLNPLERIAMTGFEAHPGCTLALTGFSHLPLPRSRCESSRNELKIIIIVAIESKVALLFAGRSCSEETRRGHSSEVRVMPSCIMDARDSVLKMAVAVTDRVNL